MSVNAISGISLYEYYYKINNEDNKRKKALALERASENNPQVTKKEEDNSQSPKEILPSERPWADLMYQLNISFNEDPKDDIADIKKELAKLTVGLTDKELDSEVKDLENYVDKLYLNFQKINEGGFSTTTLTDQLKNLSIQNQAML